MKFKDNLDCIRYELIHWDYDQDGLRLPISYGLTFKFYGTEVTAYINADELQDDAEGTFAQVETDGELLASFEEVFENNNYFRDKVRKVCQECWEEELDSNDYNYQGLKE
jgi:predicted Ser/Thr protein kinase